MNLFHLHNSMYILYSQSRESWNVVVIMEKIVQQLWNVYRAISKPYFPWHVVQSRFKCSLIFHDITYNTTIMVAETESNVRITTDSPNLTITGELWGVYCGDFGKNWPYYIMAPHCNLFMLFTSKIICSVVASADMGIGFLNSSKALHITYLSPLSGLGSISETCLMDHDRQIHIVLFTQCLFLLTKCTHYHWDTFNE